MPRLNEDALKKHIKSRQFAPLYVLYGSEQMYVSDYTRKLTEAIAGKTPSDFNYHLFSGDVDLDELAAAMQVVPFMSEYNCVVLRDIYFDIMKDEILQDFTDILFRIQEGTVTILTMPSIVPEKKKTVFNKIIKKAEQIGVVCSFDKVSQSILEKQIAKWANEEGKLIPRVCAAKLIALYGTDMTGLRNEVAKICAHAKGEEVTVEDVQTMATVNLETRIFDLSAAVLAGNGQKAYHLLDMLFYQKEEPIMMLYILSGAYIDAYRARVATECGVELPQVIRDLSYPAKRSFVLGNAKKATMRVSTDALHKSIGILLEADVKFKSVKVNPRLYLEQVIASLLLIVREDRR